MRESSKAVKLYDNALRHYFTYQGQRFSDYFPDIERLENVGDMQMFFVDGEGGIFYSTCSVSNFS